MKWIHNNIIINNNNNNFELNFINIKIYDTHLLAKKETEERHWMRYRSLMLSHLKSVGHKT
jgi:hypothetical protein